MRPRVCITHLTQRTSAGAGCAWYLRQGAGGGRHSNYFFQPPMTRFCPIWRFCFELSTRWLGGVPGMAAVLGRLVETGQLQPSWWAGAMIWSDRLEGTWDEP